MVCKLLRLYGLPQSERCWYKKIYQILKEIKLKRMDCDPCVYKIEKNNEFAIIGLNVDEIIMAGTNEKFIKEISIELSKYKELKIK